MNRTPQRERTERLTIRLRPRERRRLDRAAEEAGKYVSELVRDAALRDARRELTAEGDGAEAPGPAAPAT